MERERPRRRRYKGKGSRVRTVVREDAQVGRELRFGYKDVLQNYDIADNYQETQDHYGVLIIMGSIDTCFMDCIRVGVWGLGTVTTGR